MTASLVLADTGYKVTVIEKNQDVLLESSKCNQNRIHHGLHYPRSTQTGQEALRCLHSFNKFYGDAVNYSFKKFYAISKNKSLTSVEKFLSFADSINLNLKEQWPDKKFLNRSMVDACWLSEEPVFDYYKLREIILRKLYSKKNISILRNSTITEIQDNVITINHKSRINFKFLINAAYAGLPGFLRQIGCEPIKSKFELCIMPILKIKQPEPQTGVTVMDGPFCSIMPKGFNKSEYILYHVKHSVNQKHIGYEKINWSYIDGDTERYIIDQCLEYYPILEDTELIDSWITTRVVLPNCDSDDARPTLVLKNKKNIFSIFSGKITTCVDAASSVLDLIKHND